MKLARFHIEWCCCAWHASSLKVPTIPSCCHLGSGDRSSHCDRPVDDTPEMGFVRGQLGLGDLLIRTIQKCSALWAVGRLDVQIGLSCPKAKCWQLFHSGSLQISLHQFINDHSNAKQPWIHRQFQEMLDISPKPALSGMIDDCTKLHTVRSMLDSMTSCHSLSLVTSCTLHCLRLQLHPVYLGADVDNGGDSGAALVPLDLFTVLLLCN